jgi:hypothetical protein
MSQKAQDRIVVKPDFSTDDGQGHPEPHALAILKELTLAIATLFFFAAPLAIVALQVVTKDYLETFDTSVGTTLELNVLHLGAIVVTCLGVISTVMLALASLLNTFNYLRKTWRVFRRS